jgi:hypothetical protein
LIEKTEIDTWGNTPRTFFVIQNRSSLQCSIRVVLDRTKELKVIRIFRIPENGFLVKKCDVALFFEAHKGTGIFSVRISVSASDTGSIGSAEFAKFVRIVTLKENQT